MFENPTDVSIRPISIDDTENIVRWRNAPSVKKYLYSQEELRPEQHIEYLKKTVRTGKCVQFIIVVNEQGSSRDIGTVFIKNIDYQNSKGEFGIFIGEEQARGKGFAKKATRAILDYAFENIHLNKVYLTVMADNYPAIKTYLDVGFSQEGILRKDHRRNNEFIDIIVMSILKSEWHKKKSEDLVK